jgi:large subunit ribosomal protein L25
MASTGQIVVDVQARTETGTNACRRVRLSGQVPGVVYGLGKEPFSVAVESRRVEELLRLETGRNTLFKLSLEGGRQSRQVMIRELQRDPVSEKLVHIDFVRVDPTKKLHVRVPVQLIGTAEGVKNEGGVLDFVNRDVEVSCLPSNIPESLDVDVSELHVGQHVSVKDLSTAEGAEVLDDPDTIIAVVAISRAEVAAAEEVEEAEAAEAAEVAEGAEEEGEPAKAAQEGEQEADKK